MKNILFFLACFFLLPLALRAQYSIQYVKDTEPTQCTGIILASVGSSETGPFTMELFLETANGPISVATKSDVNSLAKFDDLCEGDYTLVVTDDFGCERELDATIEGCNEITLRFPPENYITHSTDCNAPNGSIGFINQNTFNGGIGSITWEWSGGTPCPEGVCDLAPGTYIMTATDEVGCTAEFSFEVDGEELWLQGNVSASCEGQSNGSINAGATFSEGGQISYAWNNGETSEKILNLNPGQYTLTATHTSSGCTAIETFSVGTVSANGLLSLTGVAEKTCPGYNSGKIITTVSGGTAPYSYEWSSGGFGAQSSYLSAGSYEITVTDYCGAQAVASFFIYEFDEPALSIEIWDACSGDGTGGIGIGQLGEGTVNSGVYSFYLNAEPINVPFGYTNKNLPVGNHVLEAVSINGCSTSFDIRINSSFNSTETLKIDLTKPENINCHGSAYLNPKVSGGTLDYSFIWRDHYTNQIVSFDSQLDQSFVPGLYNLTVRDKCGNIDYYPIYDFRCNCDHQFVLSATGATPCIWPYKLKINSLLLYEDLTYGYYDFEWSYDGNSGSNTDASFTKYLGGGNEWENRQKTYWNSGVKTISVSDPRGCNYKKSFEVSGQSDNVASITNFATNIHTDLYELRPNLFPPDFEGEFLVQTGCGVFETCGDNYNDQQSTVLLNYTPFSGDHPDPCQRGGTLKCGFNNNPEATLDVPENSIATYFVDTDGNCGCLFPPALFTDENFLHPFYVEFQCDQIVEDTSSQGVSITLFDPELCVCDMCFWHTAEESNCAYSVTCASTMEVIATVEYAADDWSICKGVFENTQNEDLNFWYARKFCPLDECLSISYMQELFIDINPETIFPNWEDLPDCKTCHAAVLVELDSHEIGDGIHSLNDSSMSDTLTVNSEESTNIYNGSQQSSIFPNPVRSGQRNIRIANINADHVDQVELISASGKIIEMPNIRKLDSSTGRLELNQKLSAGMYFIHLTFISGESIVHKMVII